MVGTNGKRVFDAAGAEAVFTTTEYIKRYITGFSTEGGFVLIDKDGTYLYTDARYTEAALKRFQGTEVEVRTVGKFSETAETLKKYGEIAIPLSETYYTEYERLKELGVKLTDSMPAIRKLMEIKTPEELSAIAKASEIAEEGLLKLLPQIKEGMTETEVAALLEFNMRTFGAEGTSFDTIVAFGAHAAVPHHVTGREKLRFGDEILIDFGCKVEGYCSDITRTFLFGDDKKHEAFKAAYKAVLGAHEEVKERLKAGMTAGTGDAIAREYLEERGYGKYFTHSLGHGIGLNIHEYPFLRRGAEEVLENGMVFSDEPGVYVAGEYGIRIEDSVTLENGNVKSFMSKTDRNLVIL